MTSEEYERLTEIHGLTEKLTAMGISEENIIKLWIVALETANKIVNEA